MAGSCLPGVDSLRRLVLTLRRFVWSRPVRWVPFLQDFRLRLRLVGPVEPDTSLLGPLARSRLRPADRRRRSPRALPILATLPPRGPLIPVSRPVVLRANHGDCLRSSYGSRL